MDAIVFQNFSSYYKEKNKYITALDRISLTVKQGELLVVVGPSGSGKSTLLKACLGLADFIEGDLLIDGAEIDFLDLRSGKFAYVGQELSLYPNLTIYENLAFPLRTAKMPHPQVDQRVKEIADLLDIRILLTRKPRHLSVGQQQRVAIGRALIKHPSFLFFDEPFSNVEPLLQADLSRLVRKLHETFQATTLFVTHQIPEALALGDRIIVLEDGKIVESGTSQELRRDPESRLMAWMQGMSDLPVT